MRSLNNLFLKKKKKRTRSCDIGLSATSSDEILCGSSTQKPDRANSKKEMKVDSTEEISTDLLNENDTQQSPSYSIKRNDSIHADAILKSPSFSAPEEFNDTNIGLRKMKEHTPNKIIVGHLNINFLRNKFEALQFIINRNLDIMLLSETKLDDSFPSAQFLC